jgi:Glycosyltransferase WbsX
LTTQHPSCLESIFEAAINRVSKLPSERQFIFIKSWNEWAEGNYLEPDQRFGHAYLEEIGKLLGR